MLGLIKKDLLIVKNNLKLIGIVLTIFFILALQDNFDITFALPFIAMIYLFTITLFISTFSYDEFNKWDAYAVTLPNGRKNIVKSKYITSIILVVSTLIITLLLTHLITFINGSLEFEKVISLVLGLTTGIIFVESIMLPIIFKFGIEKGRLGLFGITIAITGIATIVSKKFDLNIFVNIIQFFDNYYFIIIPLALIILLLLSYKISDKIYSKKEF